MYRFRSETPVVCWRCPHSKCFSMSLHIRSHRAPYAEQGLCIGRMSVCLSRRSTAAAACGGFLLSALRGPEISIDSCGRRAANAPRSRLVYWALLMRLASGVRMAGHGLRIQAVISGVLTSSTDIIQLVILAVVAPLKKVKVALKRAATSFAAWWTEAQWVWTVCLRLLPDSVATAIWTRTLLRPSQAR